MASSAYTRVVGGRLEAEHSGLTAGFEGYHRSWDVTNTMRMSGQYVDQLAIPDVGVWAGGFYGIYERSFGRLELTGGARLDAARMRAKPSALDTTLYLAYSGTAPVSRSDLNPSGNLRLRYPLPAGLELFAGAGSTVRLPDPEERYFALKRMAANWVGNPTLRPTRNTEADLGVNYRAGRLTVRPTVFYSRLTNFTIVYNNNSARSYADVDARMYGGELGYTVILMRALILLGGVSVTRGAKATRPGSGIFDPDLAEIPPLQSRTALRYGGRYFFGEFEALAAGAQHRVDSDVHEQPTAGYALFNFKAGVHTSRLNLSGGVENLLNRFYYEYCSYQRDPFRFGTKVPEPGRNLYLRVGYNF
jgi:iron complex outermembrane receptor protein